MGDHKERMMLGEPYLPEDAELTEDRLRCARLLDRFNAAGADANDERRLVLGELLGAFGPGSWIMPPFRCDYGYQIRLGRRCFVNYDGVLLDEATITLGDDVQIGPKVQLLTALHPMADHELRRQRWETAAPISIGENAWLASGVIVCPGVTIGENTVIGAGSVVTRDVPARRVRRRQPLPGNPPALTLVSGKRRSNGVCHSRGG